MNEEQEYKLLSKNDFQSLLNSTRDLTQDLALETLLDKILINAGNLTDSPEASIILLNEKRNALYIAAATGEKSDWVLSNFGEYSEKAIPIEGSVAGDVFKSQTPVIRNEIKEHFSEVDKETRKQTKSMVCVPLKLGEERLGVIQVLNKSEGDYSQRDLLILEYFADQASVAIRNAKLIEGILANSGLYESTYSTEKLYDRIKEINEEAKTVTLSVMFADMRGFTQLCQSLVYPELVQHRLSEFISMLSDCVLNHNGIVNKFLGDGIMAIFQKEEHSVDAVQCAFQMQKLFYTLIKAWNEESNQQLDFLDIGIGVTTDKVILGGIGNRNMRDYTVIGTSVNLAAAFEYAARKDKKILCDQKTFKKAEKIISSHDDPFDFPLKKPGQDVEIKYKCYHLNSLKKDDLKVFISHNHKDRELVESLIQNFNKNQIKTWYSKENIKKGSLWTAEVRKALSDSNYLLAIVSENSAGSDWVKREIDMAANLDNFEEKIIPVIVDNTNVKEVNEYLSQIQGIESDEPKLIVEQFLALVNNK